MAKRRKKVKPVFDMNRPLSAERGNPLGNLVNKAFDALIDQVSQKEVNKFYEDVYVLVFKSLKQAGFEVKTWGGEPDPWEPRKRAPKVQIQVPKHFRKIQL